MQISVREIYSSFTLREALRYIYLIAFWSPPPFWSGDT